MDELRFNNRDVKITIKHFLNGMPNQVRVYGVSFLIRPNGEFVGKEYLPLNWFQKNNPKELLPEYESLIMNETQNLTRVYKYIANTSEEIVGMLDLKKDSDLIQAVMLLGSNVVKAEFLKKYPNSPLLYLEREDIKKNDTLKNFNKKFEIEKEIYANKDVEHVLDRYVIVLGYNPSNFDEKYDKLIWLLRQVELDLDKVYNAITMNLERQVELAFFNIAMQMGLISNIIGQGYKYGEVYIGHTQEEAMAWLQKSSNRSVKDAIYSQIPEKRKRIVASMYSDVVHFPETKEVVANPPNEEKKTKGKKTIEDRDKELL